MPFVIALIVAAVFTPVGALLGRRLGLIDRGGDPLKIHDRPIPLSGGLTVAAAAALGIQVGKANFEATLVAAFILALVVGVLDDLFDLPPVLRLAALAVVGVAVVYGALPGSVHPLAVFGSVLVVLLCTNAVNMIDGQNGLAAGLAALASGALGIISLLGGNDRPYVAGLAVSGALLGFLVWNFPRASIFLGDGGAYLIGALLAYQAIVVTSEFGFLGLVVSGAALGIFALEFAITVYRRAFVRLRLTRGDRYHSYDMLAARFSRTVVTALFWVAGVVLGSVAIVLSRLPLPVAVASGVAGGFIFLASAVALTKAVKQSSTAGP